MADYRTSALKSPIDVAEYLFLRLQQIGVDSIHGVPGDYNLIALDYVPKVGLKWVGNVNELNAGYAADGYARVKGISAIVTTFGVGELSAINAMAGAYSEHVPVVHIVGTPSTASQKNGMLLHHTLGNGNFNVFADMSQSISCVMEKLNDPITVASQIDHALQQCWIQSRPVYLSLPTDVVQKKIEGERLKTPIDLNLPENDPDREAYVVDVVLKSLLAAKNPIILVDACAIRHRYPVSMSQYSKIPKALKPQKAFLINNTNTEDLQVLDEVHDLIEKTNLPVFVTPMGKGAVNEEHSNYGGVYAGEGSQPDVKKRVEASDLILTIGAIKSDFNTAGFSYKTSQLNTIDFHSTHITVRYSEYPGVHMRGVLRQVINKIDLNRLSAVAGPTVQNEVNDNDDGTPTITQAWFWPRVGQFLKENDIVITETGTSNFGIWETKFPKNVTALSQVLWGSIGYSVGATQGAALAARDAGTSRRTILFVGDGSFQLTAQEVSTMIRLGLKVTIFVVCNDGFTIERFIHGVDAEYNDIAAWNFKDIIKVFGAKDGSYKTFQVKTKAAVNQLFADEAFNAAEVLQFVELYIPRDDAPRALKLTAEASAANNAKQ
ncbi:Pyruvate decarboxylase [Lachnellula subtilissima]|uniref:Pyruvate decarboxylase n=1 Tax=Lachnellula subtilissima TaxID=602034 RepID=A0A8H8RKH2_9HELO|nr:Pyruvate decarboxylase [Lachnellula subtilissima]